MLNTLLSTLLANPGYLSLGALVLSTFFAGTMLQGERIRKEEIREELREIQELTRQSLAQVEQIQVQLEATDARLVGQIGETYEVLVQLNKQEQEARAGLEEEERRRLARQRSQLRQEVNNTSGFVFNK